jgi:hypothetical protein
VSILFGGVFFHGGDGDGAGPVSGVQVFPDVTATTPAAQKNIAIRGVTPKPACDFDKWPAPTVLCWRYVRTKVRKEGNSFAGTLEVNGLLFSRRYRVKVMLYH